jgi:hypothetical protein
MTMISGYSALDVVTTATLNIHCHHRLGSEGQIVQDRNILNLGHLDNTWAPNQVE